MLEGHDLLLPLNPHMEIRRKNELRRNCSQLLCYWKQLKEWEALAFSTDAYFAMRGLSVPDKGVKNWQNGYGRYYCCCCYRCSDALPLVEVVGGENWPEIDCIQAAKKIKLTLSSPTQSSKTTIVGPLTSFI